MSRFSLFDNDFGTYELVPKDIEKTLFAGAPPFSGLDAVFVSHHHGDHSSPQRMLQLLEAHPNLQFFGPAQAIESMPDRPSQYPEALRGRKLLSVPGEEKRIPILDDVSN